MSSHHPVYQVTGRHYMRPSTLPAFVAVVFFTQLCGRCEAQGIGQTYNQLGLLGEYFTPMPESASCTQGNGSTNAFDGLLPTHTLKDQSLEFKYTSNFRDAMPRCAWQTSPQGRLTYLCRATDEHLRTFAVRWSGYLQIVTAGTYNFSVQATDGARIIIGHADQCPGVTCGSRHDVENIKLKDLRQTADSVGNATTFMQQCPLCAAGNYEYCWVSSIGCQPFAMWQLEADGGLSGKCGADGQTFSGGRWLTSGYHAIRVEFFKRNPGSEAQLFIRYSGPDTGSAVRPLPPNRIYFPQGMGLRAEWYAFDGGLNALPALGGPARVEGRLLKRQDDLLWKNAPELAKPFNDEVQTYGTSIAIRWSGFFRIVRGGTYKFRLLSDDGSRFVLGGRGSELERVIVDNDGVHGPAVASESTAELLPGLHPCRLEYFYKYEFVGEGAVPQPEGVSLLYSGPDTFDSSSNEEIMTPVAQEFTSRFQLSDPDCPFSNLEFNGGMSQARACDGECFHGREGSVGDGMCDCPLVTNEDGSTQCQESNFPRFFLQCAPYDFDSDDCLAPTPVTTTTTRAQVQCLETCPPGNFRRRDCSSCSEGSQDGNCIKSRPDPSECASPEECTYLQCCAAFVEGIPYWGTDCISFGSTRNCSLDWPRKLEELRNAETMNTLPARVARWSTASVVGTLETYPDANGLPMEGCSTNLCNPVPDDRVLNPITQLPTDELVCKTEEASTLGVQCFEGPWPEIGVSDPFAQCEASQYRYNFCLNRKTTNGIPFERCCAITFTRLSGGFGCMFRGIQSGNCEDLKDIFTAQRQDLGLGLVVGDCFGDRCNNPLQEEYACQDVVVEFPPETAGAPSPPLEVLPLDQLLDGAPSKEDDGPEWALIFGVTGTLTAGLLMSCYVAYRYLRPREEPLWHSSAAKVVAKDTFVEPVKDVELDIGYNTVKPRPAAFVAVQAQEKGERLPKVLRHGRAIEPVATVPPPPPQETAKPVSISPDNQVALENGLRELAAITDVPANDQASMMVVALPHAIGEVPAIALPALPPPVEEVPEEVEPTPSQEIKLALNVPVRAPVAKVRSRPAAAARLERQAANQPHDVARWVVR